jgi:tape measure domain-containing protein
MATVRELVTVLKYHVDKSGLREYKNQAVAAARQIGTAVRTASAVGRGGFQGLFLGLRDAVREQRTFIRDQAILLRQTRQVGGQYSALAGYLRAAFAGIGVASITNAIDQAMGSEAQIDIFAQNPANKNLIRDQIYRHAQASGSDYIAGVDMFGSIARNRSTLGLSDADAIKLADLTGKAVATTSKGAAQDSAAILQFSQALGSGVLQGDELRSILENSGGLAVAIAESFGISVTELKEMGKAGKLTAKEMAQGLLKQAEKIEAKFNALPKGFGKGMTLIRNAWVKTARDINEATKASERFFKVNQLVAENLIGILKTLTLLGTSWALIRMRAALMGGLQGVTMLGAALIRLRALGMGALFPFLRMATILTSLYLVGEDISVWMQGGKSLIGTLIGPASDWKPQIDSIINSIASIKEWITGSTEGLGAWLTKWGTISVVVGGLAMLFAPFVAMIVNLATYLVPLLWAAITKHPIGLLIAALGTVIANWDTIISKVKEAWGYISKVLGTDGASFRNPDPNNPAVNYGNARERKLQNINNRAIGNRLYGDSIDLIQNNYITTNGSPAEVGRAVGSAAQQGVKRAVDNKPAPGYGSVEAPP